jgi:hypothetical protein
MNRYFFHVRDGHTSLDTVGLECAGMDEVRAEALKATGEILKELGPEFWKHRAWSMWVTDESEATLLTLQLSVSQPTP